MENLSLNDNQSILMNELFLVRMGSIGSLKDILYLYLIMPASIICVLLNILTLIFFQSKIVQKTALNTLIKIYVLTSLIICLLVFLRGFGNIPRYAAFSYSYTGRIFSCNVSPYLTCLFVLFSNSLNIVVLIERLSMFVIKFRQYHFENPHECSRLLFIMAGLVNLLVFFQTKVKQEEEFIQKKIISHYYLIWKGVIKLILVKAFMVKLVS